MLYILIISGTGSGIDSGRVLRIPSPTPNPNPNLAIGENPTPIPTPTPVNSNFPRQNRDGSGAGPVAMPTRMLGIPLVLNISKPISKNFFQNVSPHFFSFGFVWGN